MKSNIDFKRQKIKVHHVVHFNQFSLPLLSRRFCCRTAAEREKAELDSENVCWENMAQAFVLSKIKIQSAAIKVC